MGFIERILGGATPRQETAWTSASALNAVNTIVTAGFNFVLVTLRSTSTITAGVIQFEGSDDGTNWYPVYATRDGFPDQITTYTLAATDTKAWKVDIGGFTNFRVRLSTQITGSGTVTIGVTAQAMSQSRPKYNTGKAVAHGSNPSSIGAGAYADLAVNRHGIPFMIGGHPNIITKSSRFTTSQANTDIIGAISAGQKIVVVGFSIGVSKATTVNVGVKLGFGATVVPADGTAISGVLFDHEGLEPGSGAVVGNGSGILGIGADGEELRLTSDVPTTGALTVTVQYFIIES